MTDCDTTQEIEQWHWLWNSDKTKQETVAVALARMHDEPPDCFIKNLCRR